VVDGSLQLADAEHMIKTGERLKAIPGLRSDRPRWLLT
jgi:hypothetical protein